MDSSEVSQKLRVTDIEIHSDRYVGEARGRLRTRGGKREASVDHPSCQEREASGTLTRRQPSLHQKTIHPTLVSPSPDMPSFAAYVGRQEWGLSSGLFSPTSGWRCIANDVKRQMCGPNICYDITSRRLHYLVDYYLTTSSPPLTLYR